MSNEKKHFADDLRVEPTTLFMEKNIIFFGTFL